MNVFISVTVTHFDGARSRHSANSYVGTVHGTKHHDANFWRGPPTKAPAASPPQWWARITAGERKQSPPPHTGKSVKSIGDV